MVPGSEDVVFAELELERGNAGQRPGRSPDLGRVVRLRGEVVAEQGALGGETVAGELHPVAGVPGEAYDHRLPGFDLARGVRAASG